MKYIPEINYILMQATWRQAECLDCKILLREKGVWVHNDI